ncbi:MAG: class I SAM-dependent methyltransferase [Candidatus Zambryskibacteria bacterium]|nr:class I SAM-dependent methyltransferase [Candidatus Zambryskibacteria bacterium]
MKEIKRFTKNRYWGKVPEAELEKALDVIDLEGWAVFTDKFKDRLDFTTEENRADWRFFIALDHNSIVLDAGAGLGRISIPLARVVRKVVACDTSVVRMRFLNKLAEAKGLSNIETVVADIFNPPFEKESFDLIVMNGLLEWVGRTDLYNDPREAQIACLKICRGLLKKGGFLYVGIENRFALAYLRGIDHSSLKFTSYMPRWLANKYTLSRTGHRYDTYTYNISGYKKLLNESGFTNPDFYLVYPGYNLPRIIIPYTNLRLLKYTLIYMMPANTIRRKIAKMAARSSFLLWIYRKLFFSFNIFAQK